MSLEGLNGVQSLYCDPSDFNWHLQSVATSSRGGWGWEQYAPLTLFLSQSWNGFGCGTGGFIATCFCPTCSIGMAVTFTERASREVLKS